MSIHLVECAARLNLPPSTKLALMAFADSADRVTRVAFPGLDHVKQWASLNRSRAQEVVADLVRDGYLVKHRGGAWGRRAEYVVFPHGCCEAHAVIPADEEDRESAAPTPGDQGEPGAATADSSSVKGATPPAPENGVTTAATPATGTAAPDSAPGSDEGSDTGSDSYRTPTETPLNSGERPTYPTSDRARAPTGQTDRDKHGPLHPTCPDHRDTIDPPPCHRCASWREDFDAAELARAGAAARARSAQFLEDERRAKARTAHVDTSAEVSKVRHQIRPTSGART